MTNIHRAASILALVCALAGCSERRLTIAVPAGVEGVALKVIAADFADAHGVRVEIVELSYDALFDSIRSEMDNTPSAYDVVMMDDPWFYALLQGADSTGPPLRLERLEISAEDEEDFIASCLDVCRYPAGSRDLYAVPFVGNTQLFVYRETAGRLPSTWAELVELQRQHAEGPGLGYVMRVGSGNSIVTDFMPLLWSEQARPDPDTPATRAALLRFRELARLNQSNLGLVAHDDFDLAIHLVKDTASMSIVWSAWAMAIARALETPRVRQPGTDLFVGAVPGGRPTLGAWLLGVPSNGSRQADAKAFVRFATGREQILRAAVIGGNPPPRASAFAQPAKKESWLACQLLSLRHATPRPRTPSWRRIEAELGTVLSALNRLSDQEEAALAQELVRGQRLLDVHFSSAGHTDAGRNEVQCEPTALVALPTSR